MQKGTLYFHYPCFDGLVSGVLAWVFLENSKGWRIEQFRPVNYELRETWLSTDLGASSAVVDFLYHPQAIFWADHHITSFVTNDARRDFEQRKSENLRIFDQQAASCASLLWERVGSRMPDSRRYEEMVDWAKKIDSASYSSPEEAIFGDSPAMKISRSLILQNGPEYPLFLLREMRAADLSSVAQLAAVKTRADEVQRRILAGIKSVDGKVTLRDGGIAIFDIPAKEDQIVNRYAPYHFFPEARYSIGVVRSDDGIRITAMRNPWRDFESVSLGKILAEFGGGGHHRVAAVAIPTEQADKVAVALDRLVSEMHPHAPIAQVTA